MHYDHQHRAPSQINNMSGRFNYFQRLPAEIRTMIWEYSLPESRVYEVLDAPNATQKTPAQQGLMFANVHPEPPPALAAVCRESRYFVLHHYKPVTLGKTTKYVDLSRDILLLEPYLLVKRLYRTLSFMGQIPLMRDNINRLALGTSYGIYTGICHPVLNWKVSKTNVGKLLSSLAKFPKLKTLIFIVHQEFQFEFDFRFPHAGGSSFGTLTHDLPMSHHASALHSAAAPFQPPFINNLRNPPAVPTPGPLPPPVPRTPAHLQQHRPPTHLPQPQMSLPPSHLSSHSAPPPPSHPFPIPPATNPLPPPPPSSSQRAQQVHQAYRFKFDIEANINHTPRRPHLNELLYYPLDYDEDKDDWDLNDPDSEGEGSEWCDPWPTNDDWRRFRRRFGRAMRGAAVQQGLGGGGGGGGGAEGEGGEAGCGRGGGSSHKGATGNGGVWGGGLRVEDDAGMDRDRDRDRERLEQRGKGKICVPALKGASLLWRYTKGGYV